MLLYLYTRANNYDSAKWYVPKALNTPGKYENLGDLSNALGMYSGLLMDINQKAGGTELQVMPQPKNRYAKALA
jgi:hypothetical protein